MTRAQQQYVQAKERQRLQTLTAPVDGTMQQMAVRTIGGVVSRLEKWRSSMADRRLRALWSGGSGAQRAARDRARRQELQDAPDTAGRTAKGYRRAVGPTRKCLVMAGRGLRWFGVLVAISFVVCGAGVITSMADENQSSSSALRDLIFPGLANQGSSRDLKPIELCFRQPEGPLCWHIPKAYLSFVPNWKGGEQKIIVIDAALFWDSDVMPPTSTAPRKPDDRLLIYISQGGRFFARRYFQENLMPLLELVATENGFNEYRYKEVNGRRVTLDSIFVPTDHPANFIYFNCTHHSEQQLINCDARIDFMEDVTAHYVFFSGNLPRWREIDTKVRLLMKSFLTSDSSH
jgi:hypothetical protein